MALVLLDRVQQTGTANTTVSFTLSGSVTGFQSFAAVGNGNTTYYSAVDGSGNWEVGIGTYSTTGPTLTRTTILSSSNSGSAATFTGAVSVVLTYPSGKSVNQDASGNVGIGTTSPTNYGANYITLDIKGTTQGSLVLGHGSTNDFIAYGASTESGLSVLTATPLIFGTNNAERMRIDSSGNVGIGTSSPSTKLDVNGSITVLSTAVFQFGTGFTNYISGNSTSQFMQFYTNSAEAMRITSAGNVGIGTSSPSTKLTVSSATNAGINVTDGTVNTIIYNSTGGVSSFGTTTNHALQLYTNNTAKVTIDTSGNVGIGTTTPSTGTLNRQLTINSGASNLAGIVLQNNGTGTTFSDGTYLSLINTTDFGIYNQEAGAMLFGTNNTERMRIVAGGEVGIGVTVPTFPLEVQSNSAAFGIGIRGRSDGISVLRFLSNNAATNYGQFDVRSTEFGINAVANVPMLFSTNNAERMRIDSSGNVGIGTSSPSSKLSVGGNPPTAGTIAGVCAAAGRSLALSDNVNSSLYVIHPSGLPATIATDSGGSLAFATNGTTERMRIDSIGNLLVGKTTASETTGIGFVFNPTAYSGATPILGITSSDTTSATDTYHLYSTGASAFRFYVDMAGTIHATSISITAISDERLKENIKDIDIGLDAIMALKPRRFDWKEGKGQNKKNAAGFIAQEFETVFPESIGLSKAGGDGIQYKNINHETLIPTLVKAIQELKAEIDLLKGK